MPACAILGRASSLQATGAPSILAIHHATTRLSRPRGQRLHVVRTASSAATARRGTPLPLAHAEMNNRNKSGAHQLPARPPDTIRPPPQHAPTQPPPQPFWQNIAPLPQTSPFAQSYYPMQQAWGFQAPFAQSMPRFYPNTQYYGLYPPPPGPLPPSQPPPAFANPPPPPSCPAQPLQAGSANSVAKKSDRAAKRRAKMDAKEQSPAVPNPDAKEPTKAGKKRHGQEKIMLPAPQPTGEYIMAAIDRAFVIDPPHERMLVVLDLNGTLIYRPDPRKHSTRMIARPFLAPFLEFLFDQFDVMIWSSARPQNVNVIVDNALSPELRAKLTACWSRDHFGLAPHHYAAHVQVYKDLTRIWNHEPFQHRYGQHNTILIDDSAIKASAQPHNLIEIPEFEATEEQMGGDFLREVAGYLVTVRMQNDVSRFMYSRAFKADGTWTYDWPAPWTEGSPMDAAPIEHSPVGTTPVETTPAQVSPVKPSPIAASPAPSSPRPKKISNEAVILDMGSGSWEDPVMFPDDEVPEHGRGTKDDPLVL